LAIGLIEKYVSKGDASARAVEAGLERDLRAVPAKILADHVVKHTKPDDLFQIAKKLEHQAFSSGLSNFDGIGVHEKAFVGVLLDYCGLGRSRFAKAWSQEKAPAKTLFPDSAR